jgi:hypothetical protein
LEFVNQKVKNSWHIAFKKWQVLENQSLIRYWKDIGFIRELWNLPAKSLAGKSRILAIRKFMNRPPKKH